MGAGLAALSAAQMKRGAFELDIRPLELAKLTGTQPVAKANQDRPIGYLVREAPKDDVRNLQQLAGHLQAGLFITKFRKTFARAEMNDDLFLVPARYNDQDDSSEYEEILPTSPP